MNRVKAYVENHASHSDEAFVVFKDENGKSLNDPERESMPKWIALRLAHLWNTAESEKDV
jgi:hypothetical protein